MFKFKFWDFYVEYPISLIKTKCCEEFFGHTMLINGFKDNETPSYLEYDLSYLIEPENDLVEELDAILNDHRWILRHISIPTKTKERTELLKYFGMKIKKYEKYVEKFEIVIENAIIDCISEHFKIKDKEDIRHHLHLGTLDSFIKNTIIGPLLDNFKKFGKKFLDYALMKPNKILKKIYQYPIEFFEIIEIIGLRRRPTIKTNIRSKNLIQRWAKKKGIEHIFRYVLTDRFSVNYLNIESIKKRFDQCKFKGLVDEITSIKIPFYMNKRISNITIDLRDFTSLRKIKLTAKPKRVDILFPDTIQKLSFDEFNDFTISSYPLPNLYKLTIMHHISEYAIIPQQIKELSIGGHKRHFNKIIRGQSNALENLRLEKFEITNYYYYWGDINIQLFYPSIKFLSFNGENIYYVLKSNFLFKFSSLEILKFIDITQSCEGNYQLPENIKKIKVFQSDSMKKEKTVSIIELEKKPTRCQFKKNKMVSLSIENYILTIKLIKFFDKNEKYMIEF